MVSKNIMLNECEFVTLRFFLVHYEGLTFLTTPPIRVLYPAEITYLYMRNIQEPKRVVIKMV